MKQKAEAKNLVGDTRSYPTPASWGGIPVAIITRSCGMCFTAITIGLAIPVSISLSECTVVAQLPPQQQTEAPLAGRIMSQIKVIYVNPTLGDDSIGSGGERAPFKTITQALRVAQPNTVILLSPGTYSTSSGETFPLMLKSSVSIQGDPGTQGHNIVIQGGGTFLSPTFDRQDVAILGANQAGLNGVTVTNPNPGGYGMWIESSNPVVINNTFAGNTQDGISISGNSAPIIRTNYFYQNGVNGITIYGTSRPEVRENVFEKTGFGISIAENAAPVLISNRLSQNRTGIVAQAEARPVLRNNVIEGNTENGIVASAQARPDLGTTKEPGSNVFSKNGRYDIDSSASGQVIPAYGNKLASTRIIGSVDLAGTVSPVAETTPVAKSENQLPSPQLAQNPQPTNNNTEEKQGENVPEPSNTSSAPLASTDDTPLARVTLGEDKLPAAEKAGQLSQEDEAASDTEPDNYIDTTSVPNDRATNPQLATTVEEATVSEKKPAPTSTSNQAPIPAAVPPSERRTDVTNSTVEPAVTTTGAVSEVAGQPKLSSRSENSAPQPASISAASFPTPTRLQASDLKPTPNSSASDTGSTPKPDSKLAVPTTAQNTRPLEFPLAQPKPAEVSQSANPQPLATTADAAPGAEKKPASTFVGPLVPAATPPTERPANDTSSLQPAATGASGYREVPRQPLPLVEGNSAKPSRNVIPTPGRLESGVTNSSAATITSPDSVSAASRPTPVQSTSSLKPSDLQPKPAEAQHTSNPLPSTTTVEKTPITEKKPASNSTGQALAPTTLQTERRTIGTSSSIQPAATSAGGSRDRQPLPLADGNSANPLRSVFPTPSRLESGVTTPTATGTGRLTPKPDSVPAASRQLQSTRPLTLSNLQPKPAAQSAQEDTSSTTAMAPITIPVPPPISTAQSTKPRTIPQTQQNLNFFKITSITANQSERREISPARTSKVAPTSPNNTIEFVAPAASKPVSPLPQQRNHTQQTLPLLQSAQVVESELLPVPGPNIPIGNTRSQQTIVTSEKVPYAGATQVPLGSSTKSGLRYRVVVEAESERERVLLQTLAPNAFRTVSDGREVIQVGIFSERENADKMRQMLDSNGLKANVEEIN